MFLDSNRVLSGRYRNGTQAVPYGHAGGGTVHPHGLYSLRCMAMNHRRYIGFCIWGDTIQPHRLYWQRGGRHNSRPYRRGSIQPHGLYSGRSRNGTQAVPGTAHRPFPTVSLVGAFLNQRIPKQDMFVIRIIVNCSLSIVNFPAVPYGFSFPLVPPERRNGKISARCSRTAPRGGGGPVCGAATPHRPGLPLEKRSRVLS